MPQKFKKPWINNFKLDGVSIAQTQTLTSKLQEAQLEHQQLYTAQKRQLQLKAQTLRQSQNQEQQAYCITQEHERTLHKCHRQAKSQPELLKSQWRTQFSQQASYKAAVHELYTEMLNMREQSEMQLRCVDSSSLV